MRKAEGCAQALGRRTRTGEATRAHPHRALSHPPSQPPPPSALRGFGLSPNCTCPFPATPRLDTARARRQGPPTARALLPAPPRWPVCRRRPPKNVSRRDPESPPRPLNEDRIHRNRPTLPTHLDKPISQLRSPRTNLVVHADAGRERGVAPHQLSPECVLEQGWEHVRVGGGEAWEERSRECVCV